MFSLSEVKFSVQRLAFSVRSPEDSVSAVRCPLYALSI